MTHIVFGGLQAEAEDTRSDAVAVTPGGFMPDGSIDHRGFLLQSEFGTLYHILEELKRGK